MRQNKIWDNIVVPDEIENVIKNAVNIGYQDVQLSKKKKWLNIAVAMGGMAATFVLFIGAGFLNPIIANAYSEIPVIGKIFSYFYDYETYDVHYEEVAQSAEPIVSIPKDEESMFVQEKESGVNIELQEAYCDGYSLYVSVRMESDTPFFDKAIDNKEGMVQIFAAESIITSDGEKVEIGDGSLNFQGVFTDGHTFIGVARSGKTLENYNLPNEIEYTITSKHMQVYAGVNMIDVNGQWEYQGVFQCSTQPLDVMEVEESIAEGFTLHEIRLQPYEIQVVVEEPENGSLAGQVLCIEAFDENGNRLNLASNSASRFIKGKDLQEEIWMFERPKDAKCVTVYVLDEIKWLDDWKGYLYCENPWTGEQMMNFLGNNCVTSVEIELPENK